MAEETATSKEQNYYVKSEQGLRDLAEYVRDFRMAILNWYTTNTDEDETKYAAEIKGIINNVRNFNLKRMKKEEENLLKSANKQKTYIIHFSISLNSKIATSIANNLETLKTIEKALNERELILEYDEDMIGKLYKNTLDFINGIVQDNYKYNPKENIKLSEFQPSKKKSVKKEKVLKRSEVEEEEGKKSESPKLTTPEPSPSVMGPTEILSPSESITVDPEEKSISTMPVLLEKYTVTPEDVFESQSETMRLKRDINGRVDNALNNIQKVLEPDEKSETEPLTLNSNVIEFRRAIDDDLVISGISGNLRVYFQQFIKSDWIAAFMIKVVNSIPEFGDLSSEEQTNINNEIRNRMIFENFEDYDLLIKFNDLSLTDLTTIINTYVNRFIENLEDVRTIGDLKPLLNQIITEPRKIDLSKPKTQTSEFTGKPLTGSSMGNAGLQTAISGIPSEYGSSLDLPPGISLVPIEVEENINIPDNMGVSIDEINKPFKDIRLADLTLNQIRQYQNLLSALPLAERLEALEYDPSEINSEALNNPFTSVNYYSNPERDINNPLYNMTEQAERLYYKDAGKLTRLETKPRRIKTRINNDTDVLTYSGLPNISTYSGNKKYNEIFESVNTVSQGYNQLRIDANTEDKEDDEFTKLFLASLNRF